VANSFFSSLVVPTVADFFPRVHIEGELRGYPMSDVPQKTAQEMSDKDRQFEKLLSNAFQVVATRHTHSPIISPESKLGRKVSVSPRVMQWK
jgi:hypothetical protein